jgi:hypothetical protein
MPNPGDTSELAKLGLFMTTGLKFLAENIVHGRSDPEIMLAARVFCASLQKFGIRCDINTEYQITVYYYDQFICRVSAYDYTAAPKEPSPVLVLSDVPMLNIIELTPAPANLTARTP